VRGDSGDPVEVVTQTVYHLAEHFGYTVNSKGYKVLNPKVKAIYGDSITLTRAKKIYKELESKGFAACNVVLGVGSFSMQCLEDDKKLNPFTRDTFGIAIKATHIVMKNSKEHFVFKNPKESTFKKSHKGCCVVLENQNGLYCHDEQYWEDTYSPLNKMELVFKDGKMIKEYSLKEIRDRLWDNKFYE
jgi:nicotinamide phosphoribosyltransferase